MDGFGREQMVAILLAEFPSIEGDLLDETWADLLHPQMGCFARYTQERIDEGDRDAVRRCFELANRFLEEGTEELQNAVGVSFLEHLNLKDGKRTRAWARALMAVRLRREFNKLET